MAEMISRASLRKKKLTPEQALQTLFGRITDVASLPGVAQHVIHVAMNPRSTAEDLRLAIQRDPALVARILRHLNSAYYSLSSQVCDLRRAISLLGFREIRNLAMTVFVSRLFNTSSMFETRLRCGSSATRSPQPWSEPLHWPIRSRSWLREKPDEAERSGPGSHEPSYGRKTPIAPHYV